MLFLMNDSVIDIGDPETTLVDAVGLAGVRHDRLTKEDALALAQHVFFKAGRGRDPAHAVLKAIAALLALKFDADAAMFVVPANAKSPVDVEARLAANSMPMLASLYADRPGARVTPRLVSEAVWRSVDIRR